jgi:hypothetical protein
MTAEVKGTVRKLAGVGVAAILAAALGGATAGSGGATTTPGVLYISKTIVTDKTIKIPRDKFTRSGQIRYPRGALIRYEITNKGTKPYKLEVWGSKTAVMRPGRRAKILIYWNYRGTYLVRLLLPNNKPAGPKTTIQIF